MNEEKSLIMPKAPKGENRPADVICNALKIAQIATGEVEDVVEGDRDMLAEDW